MGVVGSKVVTKFVGHHIQVPGVAVDVVIGRVGQVGTESVSIRTAIHVQPSDATCARVGPLGDQVRHVPLHGVQGAVRLPRVAKTVEHGASVLDIRAHRVAGLPNVDVRRLQQGQAVQFLGVDRFDARHHGKCPFRGVVHVVEGGPGEEVQIKCDFHAPAIHPFRRRPLLAVRMRRKLLGIHHPTLERLVVPELVHVGQHVAISRLVHDVVLAPVLVKRSDNVVGHQGQTPHGLAVDGHTE